MLIRPTDSRRWYGVDGEGVGRTPHRYVYLAAHAADQKGSSIYRRRGIKTREALAWFCRLPPGRYAGYYLSYDWTKILVDLPNRALYRLLRPTLRAVPQCEGGGFTSVRWRHWDLHWIGGMVRIKDVRTGRQITIWDVGKFFQCTFVSALEKWGVGKEEQDFVADMKARRASFDATDIRQVRRYCDIECRLLARLVEALERAHDDAGVRLRDWYGPGSTASVLLRRWGIKKKRGDPPPAVIEAASQAYFGGRFEQSVPAGCYHGVQGYDIASAYPYQAEQLPCLEHGIWRHVTHETSLNHRDVVAALVHYRGDDDCSHNGWGPLPCRLESGTIVFPRGGWKGWAHLDEWRAARKYWPNLKFLDAWTLRRKCDCRPFVGVTALYEERLRIGKGGKGLALKLALNSIAGKLMQTVGSPQYHSRIWAGMITAGTRAMLLELLAQPGTIAAATDGVYSTRPLALPETPHACGLGGWEHESIGDAWFVRPGIYWASRGQKTRARGLGRRQLDAHRVRIKGAIRRGADMVALSPITVFGGARATVYATQTEIRRSRSYGEWHLIPCTLSLRPQPKRDAEWRPPLLDGVHSVPYRRSAEGRALAELQTLLEGMM